MSSVAINEILERLGKTPTAVSGMPVTTEFYVAISAIIDRIEALEARDFDGEE